MRQIGRDQHISSLLEHLHSEKEHDEGGEDQAQTSSEEGGGDGGEEEGGGEESEAREAGRRARRGGNGDGGAVGGVGQGTTSGRWRRGLCVVAFDNFQFLYECHLRTQRKLITHMITCAIKLVFLSHGVGPEDLRPVEASSPLLCFDHDVVVKFIDGGQSHVRVIKRFDTLPTDALDLLDAARKLHGDGAERVTFNMDGVHGATAFDFTTSSDADTMGLFFTSMTS